MDSYVKSDTITEEFWRRSQGNWRLVREIKFFIGKPKGRSKMISNASFLIFLTLGSINKVTHTPTAELLKTRKICVRKGIKKHQKLQCVRGLWNMTL